MKYIIVLFLVLLASPVFAQVNTEKLRKAENETGLYTDFNLAGTFSSGNSEYVRFNTGLRFDYIGQRYNSFIIAKLDYKEANNNIIVKKGFTHLRNVFYYSGNLSFELFFQKEFNEFISLNDRNILGGGVRIKIAESYTDTSSVAISFGSGIMYESEDYTDGYKEDSKLARSTNYLSVNWKINKVFSISSVSYAQVDVTQLNNYRLLNESDFSVNIFSNVKLFIGVDYRYDSQPPEEVKNYDFEFVNGIRFSI